MRSIINILDLSAGEIDQLIAVADDIMAQPEKYNEVCRHKILATLFLSPRRAQDSASRARCSRLAVR